MKWSLAAKSLAWFGISVLALLLLTLFESSFSGLPMTAERTLSIVFLILPGVIGMIYGVSAILHKEGKPWLAILGILLNLLFVLFHISLLSFAG